MPRCGECGSKELTQKNWKGDRVPYKQYEWVEVIYDFYTLGCECGNKILKTSECAGLDAVIRLSLENGARCCEYKPA
jgi:hypothetical protein